MSDPYRAVNFTVFGGALPAEDRNHHPVPRTPRSGSFVPAAAVLIALAIGAATTTAALAAMKQVRCSGYGLPIGISDTSFVYGPREMLW
jgi:hypothetical protein